MSQNINQLYIANPATSMQSLDLLYLGRSPYNASSDFAITYANFLASIQTNNLVWAVNSSATITAAANNGYILTSGSATTVTLPTGLAAGSVIGIAGQGAAWTVNLSTNSVTVAQFGNTYSTSIASTHNSDLLVLLAVTTTSFSILSMSTTGFTAS